MWECILLIYIMQSIVFNCTEIRCIYTESTLLYSAFEQYWCDFGVQVYIYIYIPTELFSFVRIISIQHIEY